MEKHAILLSILACFVFGSFAMEERGLTRKEADELYTGSESMYEFKRISYSEYRSNMEKIIPILGSIQLGAVDPLFVAAQKYDYDFAKFLLDYAKNHDLQLRFTGTLDMLQDRMAFDPNDAKAESFYNWLINEHRKHK